MKVSVLVPVYGAEKYIERCARSLFEQSFVDLEYVFVNDCTLDRSMEILEQVIKDFPDRESAVKIINHERNRGVAATRNTLLDNAEGEFVSWVDSDDWLELNAIELLVKKQLETDADVVSGKVCMHYSDRIDEIQEPEDLIQEDRVLKRLGNGWNNILCSRLIRRSIIEKNHVRSLEGCDMAEDKYQMAQITYFSNSFAVCEELVYNYERRNDNSIVTQQSKDKVLKRSLQFLQNNMGLQRFFSDKEAVFYEEASKQTMLYAFNVLKMVVKFNEKQYFQFVVNTIDETESEFWPLIGWSTKGVKGLLLHKYISVWLWLTMQRVSRLVKKAV